MNLYLSVHIKYLHTYCWQQMALCNWADKRISGAKWQKCFGQDMYYLAFVFNLYLIFTF